MGNDCSSDFSKIGDPEKKLVGFSTDSLDYINHSKFWQILAKYNEVAAIICMTTN